MLRSVASDVGLHCLPRSQTGDARHLNILIFVLYACCWLIKVFACKRFVNFAMCWLKQIE